MRTGVLVAWTVAACGGTPSPTSAPARAAASAIATPKNPGDAIVAQVNGRPVWASCIEAQASVMSTPDTKAALDECIAFELMAQQAEARGYAAAPDVIEATRAALVNRLIETGFEQKYATPADFGAKMDAFLVQNARRMDRPELRASTYARVTMDPKVAPEVDAAGRALADKIYAALAPEKGLLPATIVDVATKIAEGSGLAIEHADSPMQPAALLDKGYADQLFAIAEVGSVSPPTRTPWGWDVILYTDGLPAKKITRDELAAQAFPDFRRAQFAGWVNGIVKQLGLAVSIDVTQLEQPDPAVTP